LFSSLDMLLEKPGLFGAWKWGFDLQRSLSLFSGFFCLYLLDVVGIDKNDEEVEEHVQSVCFVTISHEIEIDRVV